MFERTLKVIQELNKNPNPQAEDKLSASLSGDLRRLISHALQNDFYYNHDTQEGISGVNNKQGQEIDRFLCHKDTMCRISRTNDKFGPLNSDWSNHSILIEFITKTDDPLKEIKRKHGTNLVKENGLVPTSGESYFSIELLQVSEEDITTFEIRFGRIGSDPLVINPPPNPLYAEKMPASQFGRWEARQLVRAYFPANQLMMENMTDEEINDLFQ